MKITRDEIKMRVRTCMEELTPQWNGTAEITEGVSIDNYTEVVIDEQLRQLLMSAPARILPLHEMREEVVPLAHSDGTGQIELPCDILRPISLLMSGWERPVTEFIDVTHPMYEQQFNRYTRGGACKPVAVWYAHEKGCQVIDYYSLPTASTAHVIKSFLAVTSLPDGATEYDLHPLLVDALVYRCASCVYDIMGNHPMAEQLLARVLV